MLVSVRWWFTRDKTNPEVNLEAAILGLYSELSKLVYRGPKYSPQVTNESDGEDLAPGIHIP